MNKNKLELFLNELCADEMTALSSMINAKLEPTIEAKTSNHKIIQRERKLGLKVMCPHCKGYQTSKNGHTKTGRQRYQCKPCNKSFSDTTNTIAFHSKKFYKHWKLFVSNELNQVSLRKSSAVIGISTTTAFAWRQKIHATCSSFKKSPEDSLSLRSEADSLYFSINMKGTKPNRMPRTSKKRGTGSTKRGISNELVGVFTAIDAMDRTLIEIAGVGPESLEKLLPFKGRFEDESLLITDSKQAYVQFSLAANMKLDQVPSGYKVSKRSNNLATINGLHGEIRNFIYPYRGVSIRHLQGYLDFFRYCKDLKYTTEYDQMDNKAYCFSISTLKKMLVQEIHSKEIPIDLKLAFAS